MSLLIKTMRHFMYCLAIYLTSSSAAAGSLEIIDGNLVDNRTGLVWMPLLTEQTIEPLSGFRGAFFSELDSILPWSADQTITSDSDIFKAFTFFASTINASQSGCGFLGDSAGAFSNCLSGWYFDQFTPSDPVYGQPHNYATFVLAPVINAIDGSLSTTEFTFTAATTLGPYYYSPSYTPDGNNWAGFGRAVPSTRPLFVVSGVPEPSSLALFPIGLALLFIRSSRLKSNG